MLTETVSDGSLIIQTNKSSVLTVEELARIGGWRTFL